VDSLGEHIRKHNTLCLDVENPGWDCACGYSFDPETGTMYFKVAKKYLDGRDLNRYEVLIWSRPPRMVVAGRLLPATSDDDAAAQVRLALARGFTGEQADLMIFDQRNHRPRRVLYKLVVAAGHER
jgi:hypothetical protein